MIELGLAFDLGSDVDAVDRRLADVRSLLPLAEESGFTSVWFGEGYRSGRGSFHLPNALLMAAAVSGFTSLLLGTGVSLLPAWSPLRLAYDAALLDRATGGRLILGTGIGTPALWQRFGVPADRMADRADEMHAALRALWLGADGYRGRLLTVEGGISPLPATPGGPPIWVGGRVGRSARRAAVWGDGWYAATSYRIGEIERMAARYRLECEAAGRAPGAVAANRVVVVGEDRARIRALAEPYVNALMERYVAIRSILDHGGRPANNDAVAGLLDELVIVGDPEDLSAALKRYAAVGVTHIQARVWPSDLPADVVAQTIRLSGAVIASAT